MTLPLLANQQQGVGSVGADDINSKMFWAVNVLNLRAYTGLGGMTVYMQGTVAPNDGGQGVFFFDPGATAADDDGVTTIRPTGITGNGRWIRSPVTADTIPPGTITPAQLADIPGMTVLGNDGSSTGPVAAIPFADIAGAAAVPTGAVVFWTRQVAPTGWLICDGSPVSRTTYANLFTTIGTTFGAGDGSTTFNLPNTLGAFLRGFDSSGAIDPSRVFGSTQQSALEKHVHIQASVVSTFGGSAQFGSSTVSVTLPGFDVAGTPSGDLWLTNDGTTFSSYNPNPGGQVSPTETRPLNLALCVIIKT